MKRYPQDIAALVTALIDLDKRQGIDRVTRAIELQRAANALLAAEADAGAWQATRPGVGTREWAAKTLGTSLAMLDRRISRHAARRALIASARRQKPTVINVPEDFL